MRVLGIDCGTEWTGYGVVDTDRAGELYSVAHGAIHLSKRDALPHRLTIIFSRLLDLIGEHQPEVVAVEEVFHAINAQTALKLGQVRGVALLAAATCKIAIAEYSPLSVKSAVCGYGRADKEQVQFMVTRLLHLAEPPEQTDASDALAVAICHIHNAETTLAQGIPLKP
ncbi:MAG TPA: crossover junction endodeoxyribonuclease RuvC [Acidobacteriaceae bacterium]|nr:crossover junction endodeoxyribonuclease RuvC [Acidobacteriaceae bacterium]